MSVAVTSWLVSTEPALRPEKQKLSCLQRHKFFGKLSPFSARSVVLGFHAPSSSIAFPTASGVLASALLPPFGPKNQHKREAGIAIFGRLLPIVQ